MLTARDAAKDFLRPYVEYGLGWLRDGHMGHYGPDYHAQIKPGGRVAILQVEGRPCSVLFKLEEVLAELQSEAEQPALWTESQVDAGEIRPLVQVQVPEKHENPCVEAYGPGPAGAICTHCKHLVGVAHARIYWKCEIRGITNGSKTDHKRAWAACARYERQEGHTPIYDGR